MHPELKAYLDEFEAKAQARHDRQFALQESLLSKLLAGVSTPQPAHPMGTAADGGLADDASVPAVAPATFSATTQAQEDPAVAHDEPLVCIEMAPATCSTVCPTQVVTITNVDEVHDAATTVFLEPAVDLFHQEVEQLTPVPPIASVDEVHNAATTVRFEPTVDLFHLGIEQQGQLLRPAPWPSFVCHSESTYVQAAVGNFWLVFCPTGQFWCCWQYEQQWPPTVPARGCVYTDFGYVWWPPDHQLRMRNELQAWLPPTRHATGVVHLSQNVKNTGTLSAELSSQYGLQLMQFKHDRVPDPMDEPLNCLQDEQLQPWYSPDHATHNPEVQSTRSHLQNAMERWAFDISASFHVTELEGISHHIFFAIHNCCLFSWDCCNMEMVVTAASQQDQRHYHGRQPDAHYILQLKGSAKHFFEFFSRKFTLMENLEKNNSEISVICTSASVVHNSNKITCPWVQSEDASTKFGELGTWPQLDYATKSVLVQDIEKHLNQSVQRRGLDISAGFSQEELEGISYHGTFAIHTAYLISCLSRPCPWPSFDCFHEGAQLRCTWPKISYVLHHFAGALNSLTESLRCCQGVHLKLLCSSFSSNCQAGDVVSEQYFVNYILILMKIQHRILHSLYFVSKPLQPSAAPFALHATFLPMEVDHTTSTAAWDKCGCQLLILRRTYHFLPDYKWEQSIPQDWEWLLSSAAQRTPLAHLKTVDSSLASPGITAITVDKSMHHGVVPPCASIQAGGDQFKNEWRLLKPNFLQASFGPCSDAYFSGNQCMVVLKLLVHPVGQLNDMIQKWSSQYHAGESSKFTYNYGICFGIPLVESELLLFELELLIPQPGEHFPLLQPKPPWPPLVTPQFSTEFCNNMRTNSEFLHLTGVLWEITRLWTYANHASTGSSYGWCFSWGTYLDTVVLAACPGSSIPQEFQSTTRNQDQYAVQSVQPTTSCEQWDPGGLDPTEPAENEHRLGGKPVVKEEGMSATQKTTKATSSRSATVVAKPAAMAAQVVSPPTDRDQRMGRASLGAIPGSRLTTSNHGKHSEGSSGLGSGKGNGGTLFPLSSPTSVLPPSFS